MHFLVHVLDVHYALSHSLYGQTFSELVVLLREVKVLLRPLLGRACLALPLGKLIDVTSPRPENFLVLGCLAVL